jgi:sodium transport system ATP-binding protein
MIEVKNLHKHFARTKQQQTSENKARVIGVRGLSFTARDGEITGLLGANGAGKSTTLRSMMGLIDPDSGSICIDGITVTKGAIDFKRKIAYLPHDTGLYSRLSGIENIVYYAKLFGMRPNEIHARIEDLRQLLDIGDFAERPCEGYSQGQKTKIALARILVNQPKTLVLDEPTNGLDIVSVKKLRELLVNLKMAGHCIVISSHIMQEVEQLCDQVVILRDGELAIKGSLGEIIQTTGAVDFESAFVSVSLQAGDAE